MTFSAGDGMGVSTVTAARVFSVGVAVSSVWWSRAHALPREFVLKDGFGSRGYKLNAFGRVLIRLYSSPLLHGFPRTERSIWPSGWKASSSVRLSQDSNT